MYLIDSTSLRLNELSEKWARFSSGVCGAKAHIIYDADAGCPVYMAVTAANVNDITAAQAMPIEAGASYVFDLGYYDYGWWAKLDAAGCRIVTRFKSNTPLRMIEERAVAKDGAILSDRVGYLPAAKPKTAKTRSAIPSAKCACASKPERFTHPHERSRRQRRRDRRSLQAPLGDRTLFPVGQTNSQDQKVPRRIGECDPHPDRCRPHRLLLLKLAHAAQKSGMTLLAFTRLVRSNLMHLKRIDRLLGNDVETPPTTGRWRFNACRN